LKGPREEKDWIPAFAGMTGSGPFQKDIVQPL